MSFDLQQLNQKQKDAVLEYKKHVRIIAGPGTGKTKTITHKIAYLINDLKVNPYKVLTLTFTNKASNEMKERVTNLINREAINIYTYHKFCVYILLREHQSTKYGSSFFIIDRADQLTIINNICKELKIELTGKEVLNEISEYKNKELLPNDILDEKITPIEEAYVKVYEKYIEYLVSQKLLDFDDIIFEAVKLLREKKEIREKYANKFFYVLVDEFQDTNEIQYELIKLLKGDTNVFTIVGDPDQTIYSWRGAKIDYILNFENDFKNALTIILDINYRSNQTIVNVANTLISNNANRIEKELIAFNNMKSKVLAKQSDSKLSEAKWIISHIQKLIQKKNIQPSEIAILYRNNFQSQTFEYELMTQNIPYKIIGGIRFFDRVEVKEVMAFISFLIKIDDFSLEKILNVPNKKIGVKFIEKLKLLQIKNNCSLWEAIKKKEEFLLKNEKLQVFIKASEKIMQLINENKNTFKKNIIIFFNEIEYFKYYEHSHSRVDNINEIISSFDNEIDNKNQKESVFTYLQNLQLTSSGDESANSSQISLITIHSTKGLEFDAVFVSGICEGILPSKFATSLKEIEEERRLVFVALTRAKKYLYVSSYNHYVNKNQEIKTSRFYNEIASYLVEEKNTIFSQKITKIRDNITYTGKEDFFIDNTNITVGDLIYHDKFGKGVVLKDLDETLEVAFNKSYGIKEIIKNHISVKKI